MSNSEQQNTVIAGGPPPIKAYYQKWLVDHRENIAEWYRRYFHTVVVTFMIMVNMMFAYSGIIVFLSRWKHHVGSPEVFLTFFMNHPPKWLIILSDVFYWQIDTYQPFWMLFIFFLPLFNWFYSTITQPIKKGHKTIISWRSEKGRKWACILSAIPSVSLFCSLNAWYVDVYLYPYFDAIRTDESFLVVKSMDSFGYVLMLIPVFFCMVATYQVLRQFYMSEDLQKQFKTWEFPLLAKQSFSLKNDKCDAIVGWDKKTNKPVVVSEESRYLHELIAGATGTGKTSTTILIRIVQDLIRIARGTKMGVVMLEPKGDAVRDVLKLCKALGVPDEKIKMVDPTDLVRSIKFNPFAGPMEAAAETYRGVLDSLTGDQDEFFKGQQNETAAAYTMLGKLRYGNQFNITHMQQMSTDPRYLADITEQVRSSIDRKKENPTLTEADRHLLDRYERVVRYFEDEVLEYATTKSKEGELPTLFPASHRYAGKQVVVNKKDKYISGAKKYLNDIVMNQMLSQLMVADDNEGVLDIDQFLEEGGVLLVNTALGALEELSLMFGQFFIRQFQSSVFRRPDEETGYKRIPIFFTIDEFPLYANEAFERMLTLGRSYRVGSLIAIQSLGQLDKVIKGYDRVILANARNKTVFGGGEYEDNERFSKQFGEEYQVEESMNESTTPVTMPTQSWGYRHNTQRKLTARFSPTDIMELPFKHFIIQLVNEDQSVQPPILTYGKFVNETKLLKKFLNIGEIELETSKHKSLNIDDHLRFYKSLITKSISEKGVVVDDTPSAETKSHDLSVLPRKEEDIPLEQSGQRPVEEKANRDFNLVEVEEKQQTADTQKEIGKTEQRTESNDEQNYVSLHDQDQGFKEHNQPQNEEHTNEHVKEEEVSNSDQIPYSEVFLKDEQNSTDHPQIKGPNKDNKLLLLQGLRIDLEDRPKLEMTESEPEEKVSEQPYKEHQPINSVHSYPEGVTEESLKELLEKVKTDESLVDPVKPQTEPPHPVQVAAKDVKVSQRYAGNQTIHIAEREEDDI
jgi:hypothetical protein